MTRTQQFSLYGSLCHAKCVISIADDATHPLYSAAGAQLSGQPFETFGFVMHVASDPPDIPTATQRLNTGT